MGAPAGRNESFYNTPSHGIEHKSSPDPDWETISGVIAFFIFIGVLVGGGMFIAHVDSQDRELNAKFRAGMRACGETNEIVAVEPIEDAMFKQYRVKCKLDDGTTVERVASGKPAP